MVEPLIAMRVILHALGANPDAAFAQLIYGLTSHRWLSKPRSFKQARQIDREKNVPGSDPAELESINMDLAAVRGITRELVEMQHANGSPA